MCWLIVFALLFLFVCVCCCFVVVIYFIFVVVFLGGNQEECKEALELKLNPCHYHIKTDSSDTDNDHDYITEMHERCYMDVIQLYQSMCHVNVYL